MSETGSWLFDKPAQAPVDVRGQRVTAILVTRNGAAWLPDTLTALARLTFRPAHIIAVDNSSDDGSADMLETARRSGIVDLVLRGSPTASFGEAVAQATAELRPGNGWLWLLHDDAAPDPNALTELLQFALRTPRFGLAFPLLVRPARRRHTPLTLELGASISGTGRRHLSIEPGEAAQGQYEPAPTLGGSTCGLLVSQAAFDDLHGFSSTIPNYRDGLDLGWRANLAGYAVMTCPTAQLVHHQAGRSERRTGTIAQSKHRSETAWDRLMGMRLVSSHVTGPAALWTWFKLVLAALVRALGFLLDKAPDQARDELQAVSDFVRSRTRIHRLRKRVDRLGSAPGAKEACEKLRPPWWSALAAFGHTVADMVRSAVGSSRGSDLVLDDLLGDEFESRAGDRPQRLPLWVWGLALVALALISCRTLFATGMVRAEHLLAAPVSLAEAFHTALAAPAGTSRPPAPWLLLEAIGSIPFLHPNWFVVAVLLAAVPVTTVVAAWYLRHHLGQHKRTSWILALLYALLPALLGGLNRGDLWIVILAVMLPFFVAWLSRWPEQMTGARAWQPAAGVAVALGLAVPIVPALWLPAAAAVVVTAVRAGGGAANLVRAGVAAAAPLVLWGDWLLSLLDTPGRLVTTPSPLLAVTTTAPAWEMLLGRVPAGGLPPLWLSAAVIGALWLAAIIAIVRVPALAWRGVGALVFVTAGVALSRFTVTIDTTRSMPDAAPWLLIGFAGLISLVVTYLDKGSQLQSRDFGLAQALMGVISILLTAVMGLSLVWWAISGVAQVRRGAEVLIKLPTWSELVNNTPATETSSVEIPYFVAQGEVSFGASTLIIDQSADTARWSIRSNGEPTWGEGETRTGVLASNEAWQEAQQIVAQIEAGRYVEDLTSQLATMGVRYIVLIHPKADTAGSLEASTGLGSGTTADGGVTVVYQLQSEPTSIQLLAGEGLGMSLAPAGSPICSTNSAPCRVAEVAPESRLLISQPDDSSLVVKVGGAVLDRAESPDWRAAFSLENAVLCDPVTDPEAEPTPAGCGQVEISYLVEHKTWRYLQLVLGFLIILFALPSAHARAADRSPRRAQAVEEA
ncbi:MAG: glycosyltransferase family 2 protein [Propionibacteriaceae bacterium]|nr:glycosyltransferase family 2 protein [Propionibacteriaceae bacterium]